MDDNCRFSTIQIAMNKVKYLVFILSFTLFISCRTDKIKVDSIFINAKIYTLDDKFTVLEAMAIDQGIIIATGTSTEILEKFESNDVHDLKKAAVYPGFYDAHCHFYGYAIDKEVYCDLSACKSMIEVVSKLENFQKLHPSQTIVLGRGWDQNLWADKKMPDNKLLNTAFEQIPVILIRVDGHAVLANQKALDLAKITSKSIIERGNIELNNGKLSGILMENAADSILKIAEVTDKKIISKALLSAQRECFSYGLTSIVEAGLGTSQIEMIRSLQKVDALKIKIYAMLSSESPDLDIWLKKGAIKEARFHLNAIKFYSDGALGSRGACLLEPYNDDKSYGMMLIDHQKFKESCQKIFNYNFQVAVHAIGDSANRQVLQIFSEILKSKNDRRWRVEHAQMVNPGDLHYFNEFSIIPSVNAIHSFDDYAWVTNRIGKERMEYAYNYKNLLNQNMWLANGSDFPVASLNPLQGFFAAVYPTHSKTKYKSKALTRQQALQAMTIWAAKSCFEEKERGSIEIGKSADFVVLSVDIMDEKVDWKSEINVLATYIDGIIVYTTNLLE